MKTQLSLTKTDFNNARELETILISKLNIDVNNTFETIEMIRKYNKIEPLLSIVMFPSYCQALYEEIVFPVYVYIEYTNNYLTTSKMFEHLECLDLFEDEEQLKSYIDKGRTMLNLWNKEA